MPNENFTRASGFPGSQVRLAFLSLQCPDLLSVNLYLPVRGALLADVVVVPIADRTTKTLVQRGTAKTLQRWRQSSLERLHYCARQTFARPIDWLTTLFHYAFKAN